MIPVGTFGPGVGTIAICRVGTVRATVAVVIWREAAMLDTLTSTTQGWRHIERYAYVERPYEDVWGWLAGHLSGLGDPLPGGGRAVELRLRPGGMEVSRPVRLHVGGLVAGDDRARAALGWADATRPHLFPQLEAVLEAAPVPNDVSAFTQLGVRARYHPPFGPLGAIGDHLVGGDVVDATLTTFLDELAGAVANGTVPPSLQPDAEAAAHDDENSGPGIRRVFLTVEGLALRRGGAVGVCNALAALPGVAHVSLDPWTGLVAVDHDPARCTSGQLAAALDEQAAAQPAG